MNCFRLLLLIFLLPALGLAQRTNLTVTGGSGDARLRNRQFVHVWADPHPPGMVFDRWTGDTALLQNSFEPHTKVNPLSLNVNLTATYKPAPVWNPVYEIVNNSEIGHHFPVNPVGVIFNFHGAGGSASGLFDDSESRIFADEAVAENYAVVSLSSVDRTNRQWNPNPQLANNPDMQNVQAALNLFIARGWIAAATKVFANGVSNGGAFAPRVSRALGFNGTSIFIAAGPLNVMSQTAVPTVWNLTQNDGTIGADGINQARTNYQNLRARGVAAEYNLLAASPVYPERFWRIRSLTREDSQTIYNSLKANGFLDARDYLIQNPIVSNWASAVPPRYNSFLNEIGEQLKICYAEHHNFSDYNWRVLQFFDAQL